MSPVMEVLTGFMIAGLIYYSGILILEGSLQINNFFSFLAAMMLAYQPVRSLATLNITLNQCLSASKRVIPIIDSKSKIVEKSNSKNLNVSNGNIIFKNVNFKYYEDAKEEVLNSVNLKFNGGEMTSLVGHSGAGKSTILNLIPRFYEATKGDIIIDGRKYNFVLND